MPKTLPTKAKINKTTIDLYRGDITQQEVDMIVNAANRSLLGGGGVDGAIHQAAGPQLLAETRTLGGCETGNAKISGAYNLPAKFVIHAVGPVYGTPNAPKLLASAYKRSLEVALENGGKTIAFPAISTGIYGYPMQEASQIALETTLKFVQQQEQLKTVRFVLFTPSAIDTFALTLENLVRTNPKLKFI